MLNSPLYGKVLFNEPLSLHTNIGAGGPARIWIEPDTPKQLCELVKLCKHKRISIFTIGAGCNIIVGKGGITGICVKLNAPAFKKIEFNGVYAKSGAGCALSELLAKASRRSLGGYEFLAGIPGTVGGAISGNAGAQNKTISSLIKEIEILDRKGEVKIIRSENIKFGYRYSGLCGNIIISALFKFKKTGKISAKFLLRANLIKKINTQDYTAPSAGCIFKNPANNKFSAAELIKSCGLKGKIRCGAQISNRHANFIINRGRAKPEDILFLIRLIKKKARASYGIRLEEEVKIINGS